MRYLKSGLILCAIFAATTAYAQWSGTVEPIDTLDTSWTACHGIESGAAVPAGYGAPYNLFSANKEMVFKLLCRYDDLLGGIRLEVGNGEQTVYIYKSGYTYGPAGWQAQTYTPASGMALQDPWIVGRASSSITWEQVLDERGGRVYTLAYFCRYYNSKWRCGCRDSACYTPYWQLQMYSGTTTF